jgi:hypothetical protein
MFIKKVTINDIDTTYCCMNKNPPGVSWADALLESRTWFKTNLGTHVEGYHLLTDDQVVGHIYYAPAEKALLPYEIESNVACIYCTELLPEFMNQGYGTMMFDYVNYPLLKLGGL